MLELFISFIKDVIGIRAAFSIIVIVVTALFFLSYNEYQIRNLVIDRHFLILCTFIVSANIIATIWAIDTPKVTPQGGFGVYVARFANDSNAAKQFQLIRNLQYYLQSNPENMKVYFYDLKREFTGDQDEVAEIGVKTNAAVIVSGIAQSDKLLVRTWSKNSRSIRALPEPLDLSNLNAVQSFADGIRQELIKQRAEIASASSGVQSFAEINKAIGELRSQLDTIRASIASVSIERVTATTGAQSPLPGRAVLVGISNYPEPGLHSRSPANDIDRMAADLLRRNASWRITVLKDKEATTAGILKVVEEQCRQAKEEEQFVFHFSGHGTTVAHGEKEGDDDMEAALITADYGSPEGGILPTRTLLSIIMARKGTNIIVLDTSHADVGDHYIIQKGTAFLAASGRKQLAVEETFDGKVYGRFSWQLLRALELAPQNKAITASEWFDAARVLVSADQGSRQEPVFRGDAGIGKL